MNTKNGRQGGESSAGSSEFSSSGDVMRVESGGGYVVPSGIAYFVFDQNGKAIFSSLDVMTMSYDQTTVDYKLDPTKKSISFSNWSKSTVDIVSYPGSSAKYEVGEGAVISLTFGSGSTYRWENVIKQ